MNQQHFPTGMMPPFAPPSGATGSAGGAPLVPPPFNPALLAAYQQQGLVGVAGASNGGAKEERREDDQVRAISDSIMDKKFIIILDSLNCVVYYRSNLSKCSNHTIAWSEYVRWCKGCQM